MSDDDSYHMRAHAFEAQAELPFAAKLVVVVTETSTYVLDREAMTATRVPGLGGGAVPGLPPPFVSDLRRDAEALPLLRWPEPEVGEQMWLLLAVREDGVATLRKTTIVREVRRF